MSAKHFYGTQRLRHLIATAARFAAGEHTARVQLQGNDDIARTGAAIDTLLDTIVSDQEQLRESESALRQSEAYANAVLDTAVNSIITISTSGIIKSMNQAAEHMFGYRAAELVGHNVKLLMPDPDRARHDSYLENYLRTGEKKIIGIGREVRGLRKDGATFPMELAVSEVIVDGEHSFTGIVQDISERKRYEEQLRERDEELNLTFENAPMGMLIIAPDGQLRSANRSLCTMLGYTQDELLKRSFRDIIYSSDILENENRFQRAIRGELPHYAIESRYTRHNGDVVHCVFHAGVVHGADGKALRIVAQIEDRTEHIRAAEAEQQQRERLEHVARLSTMGEMATGIAHELNQPLTAIATYAQASKNMLKTEQRDEQELQSTLEKINNSAHRAGEVIRRLRRMVKKQQVSQELSDINAIVEDVIPLAEVDAKEHNITIQYTPAADLPMVMADSIQIQQVVLNLIRNGVDATVEARNDDRTIRINTGARNSAVFVSVEDRGQGIDDEAVHKIFDPFFTTKKSGVGIGLSICKSIMSTHGGGLGFTRNPGGGATFELTLPYSR